MAKTTKPKQPIEIVVVKVAKDNSALIDVMRFLLAKGEQK